MNAVTRLTAQAARERIAARADLHAFISVSQESGTGPVVAVKDLIDVRGLVTTNGAAVHDSSVALADARAVANLRPADVVVIGKTNLHEWAYGVSSVNRHHGSVPNPHDPQRSAGGSSSGSAVAVAAGLCDWAIGTDTAGSVRIPASLCGIVGFKPSYGLISMVGVTPLSPSQDVLGVLAPSVAVAAVGAGLMAGLDLDVGAPAREADRKFRVAVPRGWIEALDEPTEEAWNRLERLPEIPFPSRGGLFEAARVIQSYEASRLHADGLERSPDRYSEAVRGRLVDGLTISEHAYLQARTEIAAFAADVDSALVGWDAIVTPTTAAVAPMLDGPDRREELTRFTRPFSGTGNPAITVPAPVPGLPIGFQLVGRKGYDRELLRVAYDLEFRLGASGTAGVEGL